MRALLSGSSGLRRRCAGGAALGLVVLLGATPGAARSKKPPVTKAPPPTPQTGASQLVQRGVLALAMRDFHAAYAALAEAYRIDPQPDTLYQLGVVRFAEGSIVAAHDLMRRYLRELRDRGTQDAAATAHRTEAERILSRPRPPSGELRIVAQPGDALLLDGRLVGVWPLPLPLLATAGAHELGVTRGATLLRASLQLGAGQVLEARTPTSGEALSTRRLAALWVVLDTPASGLEGLLPQIDPLLDQKGLARVEPTGAAPGCAGEHSCLLAWAAPGGAEYLLLLRAAPGTNKITAELLDTAVSELSSREEAEAKGAEAAALIEALKGRLPALLDRGVGRPYATVRLSSSPAGALVTEAGRTLGLTPLTRRMFSGRHTLELSAPKHRTERREIDLPADKTQELKIELAPERTATSRLVWRRAPRPALRIGAGIAALGIGLGLVAFGASAIAVNGDCASAAMAPALACQSVYKTAPTGIGLVTAGALITGAGIGLLAWPGPLEAIDEWSLQSPGPDRVRAASAARLTWEF